ncbi:hypothetical protein GQ44DRAFT_775020 [Phaeosphaeriaceae sp. PMI808]|nr:hypothetical protein GQ44DRAFT_775020 [Phaeosphaeriaceae sp. PMI808]
MSLVQMAISQFNAFMFNTALTVSHFEGEILHIPVCLRFFTIENDADLMFRQAALFYGAILNAFVTGPLLGLVFRKKESPRWSYNLLDCTGYYLYYLTMFWVIMVICR